MKYSANLNVAPIGNGRVAALVTPQGRIAWWCFPRLDSDPVFSNLISGDEEKGFCDVLLGGAKQATSGYVRNTAIHETVLEDGNGNAVRITDFAPRFLRFERAFHPAQIFRRIEPLWGLPRITIRLRPTFNYGQPGQCQAVGSNHIRYTGGADVLAADDRRAALLHHAGDAVRAHPPDHAGARTRRATGSLHRCAVARISRAHAQLLDHLGARVGRFARLAGRDHPRRHHAEAVPVRGDGRDHRRAYHLDPRGSGHEPQLGLSLLLAAGCLLRAACAEPARRHADDGGLSRLHHHHRGRRRAAAAAGLRHHSRSVAGGARRRRPRRLSRHGPRTHRQPGRRADAARRLWQRHPRRLAHVHRPAPARHGRRGPVPPARAAWASGAANSSRSRTPVHGNIAAASASTRIRRRCAG